MKKRVNISMSLRSLKKIVNFNEYLINKRKENIDNITFALPREIFDYVRNIENRSKYLTSLINEYIFLINRLETKEIFLNFANFIRFFIYIDYFQWINDLDLRFDSKSMSKENDIEIIKNGFMTEIENGIEYLRKYENGNKIYEKTVKRVA